MAFTLIPLIGVLAARIFTQPKRRARRAAWATGLVVAVAAAFVPLVWLAVVLAAAAGAVAFGRSRREILINLGITVLVPPVLLVPWTLQVFARPALVFLQAGQQVPGLASAHLSARSLLLLSPGGPGLPPYWVTGGVAVAALAALLLTGRRTLVAVGWCVALLGLLISVVVSRVVVVSDGGGPAVAAWPGISLAIAAAGLLLAGTVAASSLPAHLAGGKWRSLRGLGITLLALAAASAPLLAAGLLAGHRGPWAGSGVLGTGAARVCVRLLRHRRAASYPGAPIWARSADLFRAPRRRPAHRVDRTRRAALRPAGTRHSGGDPGRAGRRRRGGSRPGAGLIRHRLRPAARPGRWGSGPPPGRCARSATGQHDVILPVVAGRGAHRASPGRAAHGHRDHGGIRAGRRLGGGGAPSRRDPGAGRAGGRLEGHPGRPPAYSAGFAGRWLGPGFPAAPRRRTARHHPQSGRPRSGPRGGGDRFPGGRGARAARHQERHRCRAGRRRARSWPPPRWARREPGPAQDPGSGR